ncbi:mannitol dehydrogenase family protein [Aliiglaciecola lipolytica]|uniref:Tagaturonate reductase n=1 Tax=Aliiglaciecola lipolytica E3 TaxID=1127673 RepID=K6XQA0_9ALTE|nr:mannitol dehydrogenase family protein [Aliiglaciecola lipolytica]GAC13841.1 tagaturonate reductase [Aliiglaciecola lipolytica E3]
MKQLSKTTLSELKPEIHAPLYGENAITSGIVHFGTGNFHRAHQAVYCDALLNQGETKWGITGVSMRSSDMRDKLVPQDFLYTQATLGDKTDYRIIGSIQNIYVAPENPRAVIDAVANSTTQLVTTTITEKGYCLTSGKVDLQNPLIQHDLESLESPQSTYGFLAAALIQRCAEQGAPVTILCCDNMHAGGEHLRDGVYLLLEQHDPDAIYWVSKNVAFSSSMVDRVTPATSEQLIQNVAEKLGLHDAAPVAAEPFTQWVIEDNFAGQRPPFDQVGAIFVDDISIFERIKLRFLNAGHSMLAGMGYLAGDQFIHEALERPTLAAFTEQALKNNALPVTRAPASMDVNDYIEQVFERFRNSNLPYAVLQVGSDSSQKIQQRWMPTIDDAIAVNGEYQYFAFALASWVHFIHKALNNNDLIDPLRNEFAQVQSSDLASRVRQYLELAGANRFVFYSNSDFMALVVRYHLIIDQVGIEKAIETTQILAK